VGLLKKLGKGLGKVAKAGLKVGMKGGLSQLAGGPVAGMITKKVGKRILGGKKRKSPTKAQGNTATSGYSNMERQPRKVGPKYNYKGRMQKADVSTTPPIIPGKRPTVSRKATPRLGRRTYQK